MVGAGACVTGAGGSRKSLSVFLAAPTQALITRSGVLVSLVTSLWNFQGPLGWSQCMLAELEFGGQPSGWA